MATFAPSSARPRAMALPIPLLPPVTSATLPFNPRSMRCTPLSRPPPAHTSRRHAGGLGARAENRVGRKLNNRQSIVNALSSRPAPPRTERPGESMKERFQKPTTLAAETARHLREAIITGELAPGERLNESKLTRDLGLSRSPVREAIRILESEGLLTLEPRRGAHVRPVGDDDLQEIFDLRLTIESHGLRRDPHRITAQAIAPLRQAVDEARLAPVSNAFEQATSLVAAHITNLKEAVLKAMVRTE